MPKHGRIPPPLRPQIDLDPRQLGLRAFQSGRFDEAILSWEPLAAQDARVRAALAEAHFRRALRRPGPESFPDLRRALALAPADLRYQYHLGMRLHAAGSPAEALTCYRIVVEGGGPRGAALLLAVVSLELDSKADLAALPGSTPEIRALLAPARNLLLGQPPFDGDPKAAVAALRRALNIGASEAEGLVNFWQGLGQVAAGDSAAIATLDDRRTLPSPRLAALRQAYRGAAAARAGQTELTRKLWLKVREGGQPIATLDSNLGALLYAEINALVEAGRPREAADLIIQTVLIVIGNTAFQELCVQVLDQVAHAGAAEGRWADAMRYWEAARQIVGTSSGLGTPRPLLHNLALAYEAQDLWEQAADTWRAMLRTQPRRKAAEKAAAEGAGLSPEQWSWVRRRVIECYKRADLPEEAVTIFRQLVKAEPNDLDLRIQLADALLMNDQEQAALNEVERILGVDPQFVEAQIRQATIYSARGYTTHAQNILREARKRNPDRDDLRVALARMLLAHAGQQIGHGGDRWAEPLLREAQALDPENPEIPLDLGRVALNLRRLDEARAHLAQALDMAGDKLPIYMDVIRCWVIEDKIDEARAVLARAEAAATFTAEIYSQLGLNIISATTAAPELPSPFLLAPPPPKPAPRPVDTPWTAFAREQFTKAIAAQPANAQFIGSIAMGLLGTRPDMGLAYAEQAARMAPDAPQALIIVGLALAMNDRVREAKEQLRRAAGMARKQGLLDVAREADGLRREVDSPYFRSAFQMQQRLGINPNEIDLDDLEDYL